MLPLYGMGRTLQKHGSLRHPNIIGSPIVYISSCFLILRYQYYIVIETK